MRKTVLSLSVTQLTRVLMSISGQVDSLMPSVVESLVPVSAKAAVIYRIGAI